MTDRPILFSASMIRALLTGTKTQTRRVVTRGTVDVLGSRWGKSSPWEGLRFNEAWVRENSPISGERDPNLAVPFCHPDDEPTPTSECGIYRLTPIIQAGDRLWVRESIDKMSDRGDDPICYMADWPGDGRGLGWRPSIHMPRWASRLTLPVTKVRVQRLQDINDDDAIAEGVDQNGAVAGSDVDIDGGWWPGGPRNQYRRLWDHLNAARGYEWDSNPWVVAVSFVVVYCNIDEAA